MRQLSKYSEGTYWYFYETVIRVLSIILWLRLLDVRSFMFWYLQYVFGGLFLKDMGPYTEGFVQV